MTKKEEKFYKTKMMDDIDKSPLPKDFLKWIEKTVFNSYVIIVSRIGKKKYFGKCQFCKNQEIELFNIKAGETIKCPCCGHVVKVKNDKYSNFENKNYCWLVQRCSTGYVMRLFEVLKKNSGFNYSIIYNEKERCFLSPDLKKQYWFHITTSGEWNNNRYKNMYYELPYYNYTYTRNLKILNRVNGFEYCPFIEYCKMFDEYSNILELITTYRDYPVVEKFIKCKLSELSGYLLKDYGSKPFAFSYGEKDLKTILMLRRNSSLKYVLKNNVNWEELKALRILDNLNVEVNKENMLTAHYIGIMNNDAFNYFGFEGFKKYFIKSNEEDLSNFIYDYNDYFDNCNKLNRDMNDTKWLKPNDFKIAHDQAYMLVKSKESKELDSHVKKVLKKYIDLNFSEGDYVIKVPKTANEIRLEGKNNNNCVGGYVSRVAEGSSIICFVRHTNDPKKSFYTLELNPKDLKVIQCRGYSNQKTAEEKQVQSFVKTWHKKVVEKFKKSI